MSLTRQATQEMQQLVKALRIDPDNVKVLSPPTKYVSNQNHLQEEEVQQKQAKNCSEKVLEEKKMQKLVQSKITSMMSSAATRGSSNTRQDNGHSPPKMSPAASTESQSKVSRTAPDKSNSSETKKFLPSR